MGISSNILINSGLSEHARLQHQRGSGRSAPSARLVSFCWSTLSLYRDGLLWWWAAIYEKRTWRWEHRCILVVTWEVRGVSPTGKSFRFAFRLCVRSGCHVEFDLKYGGHIFPFPFVLVEFSLFLVAAGHVPSLPREIEMNPKWNRSDLELKFMWDQSEFKVTSRRHRSECQLKSKWSRSDIEAKSTWSRSEVKRKSKWSRREIEFSPLPQKQIHKKQWYLRVDPKQQWKSDHMVAVLVKRMFVTGCFAWSICQQCRPL